MRLSRRAAALAGAVVTTVACAGRANPEGGVVEPVPVGPTVRYDRVEALEPGGCVVVYAADCPAEGACDAATFGREPIDCPEGLRPGGAMELFHGPEGCEVAWRVVCEPDSTCNPPVPIPIACPARFQPEPAPPPPRVIRSSDGRCFEHETIDCPPDMRCNPPPPRPVPCPPEGGG